MKAPYIVLFCCIATAAFAQQPTPQLPPPDVQDANEAVILEQLTARRDWQARYISANNWGQAVAKQNGELRGQLADANKAADAAKAEATELKGRVAGLAKQNGDLENQMKAATAQIGELKAHQKEDWGQQTKPHAEVSPLPADPHADDALPTSPNGLRPGMRWNNGGLISIVPGAK